MKSLTITLIIIFVFIFAITRTAYVVGHKTTCAVKGKLQTGQPYTWEKGNTCIILKESPQQPNKTPPKKHKWMI